ncbi:MAG: flavin reductase family protein [Gemmatimonadota bacterium]
MQAKAQGPDAYRRALSQFATGITVVTTRASSGEPAGITVNSFNSVSLDPPLVLWSLALRASAFDAFRYCKRYMVNVLAADQLELAKCFAASGKDRFATARWTPTDSGMPRLNGCVAWFECANRSQYEEGDHVILVGRVESFEIAHGTPLIFHDGRYVTELAEAPLPRTLRRRS